MKRTNSATWLAMQSRWQIKVQKDGERKTFSSYIPGRNGQRECNSKADLWLEKGVNPKGKKVKILWTKYIAYLQEHKNRTTWAQPESFGRIWVLPAIGDKLISKITDGDIQSILDKAAAEGKSKKTISGISAETKKFLKWCRQRKLTDYTPSEVAIPNNAREGQKQILQPAHIRTLFAVSTTMYNSKLVDDDFIHCYRYMVLTGLRPGEVIALEAQDISVDLKRTNIKGAINDYGEHTKGKNNNALRVITNCELATFELQSQLDKFPCIGSQSVFEISSQEYFRDRWHKYCETNELPKITPYELRHTFISYTSKYKAFDLNSYVGHSKEIDSYVHEVDGFEEYKASVINDIFAKILADSKPTESKIIPFKIG